MALLLTECPDRTDGVIESAYAIVDSSLSNVEKNGSIHIKVWRNKQCREDKKNKINEFVFLVDELPEEINQSDGTILKGVFNDFAFKNGAEIYGKIKTLKLKVGGRVVDLSKSINN